MAQSTWHNLTAGIPAALHKAYVRKSARQRRKAEVRHAWEDAEAFSEDLRTEIADGDYAIGDYRHFRLESHSKTRDISVLPFRDRVAQNAVKEAIEPILMRRMTDDMMGGLPGRGVLARRRAHSVVRRMRRLMNDETLTHYVKGDIRKFYDHVDNVVAMRLVERAGVTDRRTLAIVRQHLFAQKRLAIGDPFSHIIANLVMAEVVRAIKRAHPRLKVVNYADDIFVAGRTKEELRAALRTMRRAARSVRLTYKPLQVHPMPRTGTVTFCGMRYGRGFVRLTRDTKRRYVRARHRSRSMSSYNGILRMADTRRLRRLVETNDNRHMGDTQEKISRRFAGRSMKIETLEGVDHTVVDFEERPSTQKHSDKYMRVQAIAEGLGLIVYSTSSKKIVEYLRSNPTIPIRGVKIVRDWSGYYYDGTVYTDKEEEEMIRKKYNL